MIVTSQINIDLQRSSYPVVINAVQGDQNTRRLEISIYSAGVPFELPKGTTAAMRYGKPDNTKGLYDTMPDGSSAFTISGNTVSILLAPQMLTVPGSVSAQVVLMQGVNILSTFTMQVYVEKDPSAGVLESEDYMNWLLWIQSELDAYLEKLKVNGEFVGGTVVGDVNMNGQKLYGLNAPTEDDEAATKGSSESFTNTQITDRVIYGKGKNLLKNTAKSQTINGVTFTVNEDGSVTVYGTATAAAYFKMNTTLNAGAYILSSKVPETGKMLHLSVAINKKWAANEYGNGANFECTETSEVLVEIAVKQGYTADCTAYPMIRLASETDDTYEPYYEGLKEVHNKLSMELLWENPSPSSEFGEREAAFGKTDCAMLYIIHTEANSSRVSTTIVANGETSGLRCKGYPSGSEFYRNFYFSDSGIMFYSAYQWTTAGNKGTATGSSLAPLKIYGIKGVSA